MHDKNHVNKTIAAKTEASSSGKGGHEAFNKGQARKNLKAGFSMADGYKGSDLGKNKAAGYAHSTAYKGSNLKKNYAKGYSQSTAYPGNKLDITNMTSNPGGYPA